MQNSFLGKGGLLSISLISCLLLLLSGCNDDDKSKPDASKAAVQKPAESKPQRRETVELLPDSAFKRHIFDEFNTEIETHLSSPNGSESQFRYPDGKLKESITKDKSGKVTKHRLYARDGKTVVGGVESRSDGSTLWKVEKDNAGKVVKTTYWYDGKKPFSTETTRPDGSVELSYFRKGGSLWQKKSGPASSNLTVTEQFDSSGKLSFRSQKLPDGNTEILRFHENGSVKVRLVYKVEKSNWGGSDQWTPVSGEEFDKSGKLTRKVTLDSYSGIRGTENFNDDGTRTVRTMRSSWSSRIESEEVFDKDGKSLSKKEYKWDEEVSETIERSLYEKPSLDDPPTRWQNQENYPYYRYGDD